MRSSGHADSPLLKSEKARSKRGRPRGSNAQQTRAKLLRAAAKHFSSAEYSEVNLQAIASECGITGGAIYNHFASKEALFVAMAEHLMSVNEQAIGEAIETQSDWRRMLRVVLDLIEHDATGWLRYPLLISAIQLKTLRDPGRYPVLLELRTKFVAHFAKIIDRAIAIGDLPETASSKMTAELLLAFVFNGIGAVMGHHDSDQEVADLIDQAAMLLGIRVQA